MTDDEFQPFGMRRRNGRGPPGSRGGGRGRRRGMRTVGAVPPHLVFGPLGVPPERLEYVVMRVEEMEALRLCDILGLTQDEASVRMGISRRTLWADLKSARRKL